jgi:hypothetical protein
MENLFIQCFKKTLTAVNKEIHLIQIIKFIIKWCKNLKALQINTLKLHQFKS